MAFFQCLGWSAAIRVGTRGRYNREEFEIIYCIKDRSTQL
jgi:hypothetical protein